MKEAKKNGEVLVIIPTGSSNQLLKFLDNMEVHYQLFDSKTDSKPAPTIRRKLERHRNKLKRELALIRYLKKFNFKNSIVHIDLAPWQSMLALRWLCAKTQVFVTLHTSILPIPISRYRLWQAKFRILTAFKSFHIFTGNQDAKESLRTLVSNKFLDKITVTYSFINQTEIDTALKNEFNRCELCRKYNLPTDKFLVFCVGQFINRKGRWIFLEAAEKLLAQNQDMAFIWISNSKPSDEDLKKAQNYGLGKDFILMTSDQIGEQRIDLFTLMRLAHVFALPSYLEGLPLSLLEAMALGIPSISTNINGIPEAIKHLETGYLIEAGNSETLKNAIIELKDDIHLREKLSKNGRKFVLANFNEDVVAKIAVEKYIEAFRVK
ncbi:MAG: glycosyltransferase family 4 protein [Acidobacteriota bacterium]|nr:glycosyltransferase family 4 protein [Acidobacteriota bacterium]